MAGVVLPAAFCLGLAREAVININEFDQVQLDWLAPR